MRKFRYIEEGHGVDSLTDHEIDQLDVDFDMQVEGFYVLAPLTEMEWKFITSRSSGANAPCGEELSENKEGH